jgi:hypothetical protein
MISCPSATSTWYCPSNFDTNSSEVYKLIYTSTLQVCHIVFDLLASAKAVKDVSEHLYRRSGHLYISLLCLYCLTLNFLGLPPADALKTGDGQVRSSLYPGKDATHFLEALWIVQRRYPTGTIILSRFKVSMICMYIVSCREHPYSVCSTILTVEHYVRLLHVILCNAYAIQVVASATAILCSTRSSLAWGPTSPQISALPPRHSSMHTNSGQAAQTMIKKVYNPGGIIDDSSVASNK